MQHRYVKRIDDVFVMLEPIARDDGGTSAADRGVVGFDEFAFAHDL